MSSEGGSKGSYVVHELLTQLRQLRQGICCDREDPLEVVVLMVEVVVEVVVLMVEVVVLNNNVWLILL